jgi:hypothetical protein
MEKKTITKTITTTVEIVVKDVECPRCHNGEMHPNGKNLLIRGYKICDEKGRWWSQCLFCSGYYNNDMSPVPYEQVDRNKGYWFCD